MSRLIKPPSQFPPRPFPPENTEIDPSNRLAYGLTEFITLSNRTPVSHIRKQPVYGIGATPAVQTDFKWNGVELDGTDYIQFETEDVTAWTGMTLVFRAQKLGAHDQFTRFFAITNASQDEFRIIKSGSDFLGQFDDGSIGTSITYTGMDAETRAYTIFLAHANGTTSGYILFDDGEEFFASASDSVNFSSASGLVRLNSDTIRYGHNRYEFCGYWDRGLTREEMRAFARAPYGIFRPKVPMPVFVPAAGGAIQGSTTLSFSLAGAVAATGDLLASETVAVSPVGAIVATGDLLGSEAVAVSPAGDLAATGDLLASETVAMSPAGAIVATGDLLASEAIALTTAGDLVDAVAGAMAAAVTVAFAGAGGLLGAGSLVGSVTAAFAVAGDLTSLGTTEASETILISAAGAVVGGGQLAAGETLTVSPAGDLVDVSSDGVAASVSLSLSTQAALQALGDLSAAESLTFSISAIIGGAAIDLDGVSVIGSPANEITVTGAPAAAVTIIGAPE